MVKDLETGSDQARSEMFTTGRFPFKYRQFVSLWPDRPASASSKMVSEKDKMKSVSDKPERQTPGRLPGGQSHGQDREFGRVWEISNMLDILPIQRICILTVTYIIILFVSFKIIIINSKFIFLT